VTIAMPILAMTPRRHQIRMSMRWQAAMLDPLRFLGWFCFTLDVHREPPIQLFPAGRPHIQTLSRLWQHRRPRLMSVRKSRQMLITWWGAGLSLWDGLHPGKLVMLQSKRLEDAVGEEEGGDGPLGRAKFLLQQIPKSVGLREGRDYRISYDRIRFPKWHSTLWAIPQGQNIIRQRTASGIWSDESMFQPEFKDAYAAATPCIRGGGWFLSTSTANPGAALQLHEDRLDV